MLLSRGPYEQLRDALYRLEAALEDATADLQSAVTAQQLRAVVEHLAQPADELVRLRLEPRAVGE